MIFDIYADIRNCNFDLRKKYFGTEIGVSFRDCCEKLSEANKELARKFDSKTLTWNGYELYGSFK